MTTLLGVLFLVGGFYYYTQAAPQWQQAQSWLVQFAGAFSPAVRQQVESIRMMYFGSIGAMILGGLLTLAGLLQGISPSRQSEEQKTPSRFQGIGSLIIVFVVAVLLIGVVSRSIIRLRTSPAAQAPTMPTPTPSYVAPSRQGSSIPLESPTDVQRASMKEAINILTEAKALEWAYFQQYGTFTRNMRAIGISQPLGSPFIYSIPRASQSQVVVEAFGRVLTPASGIRLALFLNSDGTNRLVRYR